MINPYRNFFNISTKPFQNFHVHETFSNFKTNFSKISSIITYTRSNFNLRKCCENERNPKRNQPNENRNRSRITNNKNFETAKKKNTNVFPRAHNRFLQSTAASATRHGVQLENRFPFSVGAAYIQANLHVDVHTRIQRVIYIRREARLVPPQSTSIHWRHHHLFLLVNLAEYSSPLSRYLDISISIARHWTRLVCISNRRGTSRGTRGGLGWPITRWPN